MMFSKVFSSLLIGFVTQSTAINTESLLSSRNFTTAAPSQGGEFASRCIAPGVACISHYTAVMPDGFARGGVFGSYLNSAPGTTAFAEAADAKFLVFDSTHGAEILGSNPMYQRMFDLPRVIHEAPVYIPETNRSV
jgi:hypothetical protein